MAHYFKAIRPDGTSFHDPEFVWSTEPGGVTTHPDPAEDLTSAGAHRYLSVSTVATDCVGFNWPCRLLLVEAVGTVAEDNAFPNKRRGAAFRTIMELPAHSVFGPQGVYVAALIERAGALTGREASYLSAGWSVSVCWDTAQYAARSAVRESARYVAGGEAAYSAAEYGGRDAIWEAIEGVVWALVVRDLIGQHDFTQEHYDTLTRAWRTVIGPIHPDDAPLN